MEKPIFKTPDFIYETERRLSPKEIEIAKKLAEGESKQQILNELNITKSTLGTHIKSIKNILNLPNLELKDSTIASNSKILKQALEDSGYYNEI